ncbi:MAG: protein-L-isoaspartate(D-aspartate) O-methyltransferase [Neomegalonema sp.]|nr:protein-L-isoaspartate(D-aspartate) O-methyltransferase [Neomegalonema sp.]
MTSQQAALAMRMVLAARRAGVSDARVLAALETTPRAEFVEPPYLQDAHQDTALPIACGQTISQPSVVALMTAALAPEPTHRVLEIGTGSGYQAAILAPLCRRVYTIERHPALHRLAKARLDRLGLHNVTTLLGDGSRGWPEQAPFDRILLTAAPEDVPRLLAQQLKPGGVMVLPAGQEGSLQTLLRVTNGADGLEYEELGDVRFVPLLEGIARQ